MTYTHSIQVSRDVIFYKKFFPFAWSKSTKPMFLTDSFMDLVTTSSTLPI